MIDIAKWIDISRTPEFNPARVHRNLVELGDSLGGLAWANKVEKALLGETVIQGGYLKTELIKTTDLIVGDTIAVFAPGYDPATKETPDGAQAKASAAEASAVSTAENKIENHDKQESPHNLPSYAKMQSDGFKVYDTSGNLRTHMGQYASGKYGLKVIDGEVYSTKFKTGSETATSYIQLSPGNSPLEVIRNGRDALSIWSRSNGGMIQFFDITLNSMVGQILPFDDLAGQGLRVEGRDLSGSQTDVNIAGDYVQINAAGGVGLQPGNSYVGVYGDFHVIGGEKDRAEHTINYGTRLLAARESPEIRYVDEGRGQLRDGSCTIVVDPMLMECIEPDTVAPWCIHLTPMSDIDVYIDEIGDNYFTVKERTGQSDAEFCWSLSAARIGRAGVRMREFEPVGDIFTSGWEDELLLQGADLEVDEAVLESNWEDGIL